MARTKQKWRVGDVFAIQQNDGLWTLGQALDLMMPNIVSCAFYDIRVGSPEPIGNLALLPGEKLVAVRSVSREQLDYHVWRVVGHLEPQLPRKMWPNEKYRKRDWVGAEMSDAALAEDFLNAYYGLRPWDEMYDPNYYEKTFLISPEKKPRNLIYKKSEDG